MTELSFLLDLLLTQKLSKTVRELVVARVKIIELQYEIKTSVQRLEAPKVFSNPIINGAPQSPSTIAAMQRHAEKENGITTVGPTISEAIMPTQQIITSPVVAHALQDREQTINQALSGKPEKGRTSPRKF